ncbi:MAG TPA: hypothetical protein VHL31_15675 [Geminicoccus sp.]|jgi:hypothetical protein|uniref:DUF4170 domain-containing protein n=1 Tax=Geminicoccus sp. TaxID=2024832 RepID=UPI002E341C99|nr:hypothetical protein [Geminicoccus sp.]HEX2527722.1 hypothetical protein [Geminicoccus sp.]
MDKPCGKFWIIGGEYADISFGAVIAGTESVAGPFSTYGLALEQWRRLAEANRGNAHHRYVIAQEPPPRRQQAVEAQPALAW